MNIVRQKTRLDPVVFGNYKINNCGIVAFVQSVNKADILQSVRLEFMQKMYAAEQN